ncbi:sulfur carrier protein ThiS [Paenibacillus tengchongensis]|uniref:sulfur carrier protein ThiS n=1 Tax=Paenibacillus tengchongensis TaxID=2608684 RepID=UPI00124F2514|nr:sulfur carrier protein ThiS [Paenibacillus tengchongensis]
MRILLNGRDTVLEAEGMTVADLLSSGPWRGKRILVEVNGEVVGKSDYAHTRLAEGDRVELVHFVGGG